MPGRQLRIDDHRIEKEPYYLPTGEEIAIAEDMQGVLPQGRTEFHPGQDRDSCLLPQLLKFAHPLDRIVIGECQPL